MALDDIDDFDFSEQALFARLEQALAEAAALGATDALAVIGIDLTSPPTKALAFAKERAAELIGMKWVDGELVENPNPRWAITDATRNLAKEKVIAGLDAGLSPQELADSLGSLFDPARARMIARTETGFSYNAGAAAGYEDAGIEYLEVLDGFGCTPTGHKAGAPQPSGKPGEVEFDAEANGQVWSLEQMREYPLGHPNCVRGFVPYVAPNF